MNDLKRQANHVPHYIKTIFYLVTMSLNDVMLSATDAREPRCATESVAHECYSGHRRYNCQRSARPAEAGSEAPGHVIN